MKNPSLFSGRNIIRVWLSTWGLYAALTIPTYFTPRTGAAAYLLGAVSVVTFWTGTLLTIVALVLFLSGKVTNSKFNPRWIMYACIGAWAAYLLLIGSVSVLPFTHSVIHPIGRIFHIAVLLTLPALAVAVLGIGKQDATQKIRKAASPVLLRVIASTIIAALSIGTYAAVRTLWTSVDDGKFVYNNLANGLGCGALVLIVLLSYLQRDVYWLSRGHSLKLDERQVKERQEVFETSYKIGAMLTLAAFCVLFTHKQALLGAVQNDITTPGNILWPFANLVLALFALPLLVAAYRRRANTR